MGKHQLPPLLKSGNSDIIIFFYTFDITEHKLQESAFAPIVELDYESYRRLMSPRIVIG